MKNGSGLFKLDKKQTAKVCLLGLLGLIPCSLILSFVMTYWEISAFHQKFGENTYQIIRVYDEDGDRMQKSITDLAVIEEFKRNVVDAEDLPSPGHTIPTRSWFLSIAGSAQYEIKLSVYCSRPSTVYGRFVSKSGKSMSYYDSFSSDPLRSWVKEYLQKETTNNDAHDVQSR